MPAVRDTHRICVTFQLPSLHAQYGSKADEYLSHLIGHEGAGSLLSSLKARTACSAQHARRSMHDTVSIAPLWAHDSTS